MDNPHIRFKNETGQQYSNWELTRMDVAAEINPKTPSVPDLFYYMDLGGVDHGIWENPEIVSKSTAPSRAQRVASLGDIFFQSVRPYNMGHFYFDKQMDKPVVASTGFIQMKANRSFVSGFLYQLLYESKFNYYVNRFCTGSSYPAISGQDFSEIEVRMPTESKEQEKIASLLSELDNLITATSDEVAALEEAKKGMMQKIFSQEVRFKRDDGTEYPDWDDFVLSDFCKELKITVDPAKHPETLFEEYSMPAFDDNSGPSIVLGKNMNSSRKVINEPCVLINKLNVRKKRIWLVLDPHSNSVCSSEFVPLTSSKVCLDFIKYVALSERFTNTLLRCSSGTSNSQKRVTPDIITEMNVFIPTDPEEQQKIADFLTSLDNAIAAAKDELAGYRELKRGLLQKMFA